MKLGFIGFGEVGFEMSTGFHAEGVTGIKAFDVMTEHAIYGPLIRERAQQVGVSLAKSVEEVWQEAEVVLVAVPGDNALATAQENKKFLRKGTIYADLSASSPQTKQAVWETLKDTGVLFVDGAMLGSLPLYQHKVPTLVSGNGSNMFIELLRPYNMDLEKVSDTPGDATGIKYVRSIFMKGLPALCVEVLEAASLMKVDHLVVQSLSATMNACPFEETFNRLVTGSAVHATRRAHEMKNVIEMLSGMGIQPTMSQATFERLSWLASKNIKEKFSGKTPKSWQEVVKAWEG